MPTETKVTKTRKYSGPAKGSQEAKDRMAKVRAAQWEKNGLVKASNSQANVANVPDSHRPPPPNANYRGPQ